MQQSTFDNTFKNVANLNRVYDEGSIAFTSFIDQLYVIKLLDRGNFSPEQMYSIKVDATNYSQKDITKFGGKNFYLYGYQRKHSFCWAVATSALTQVDKMVGIVAHGSPKVLHRSAARNNPFVIGETSNTCEFSTEAAGNFFVSRQHTPSQISLLYFIKTFAVRLSRRKF